MRLKESEAGENAQRFLQHSVDEMVEKYGHHDFSYRYPGVEGDSMNPNRRAAAFGVKTAQNGVVDPSHTIVIVDDETAQCTFFRTL